MLRKSSQIRDTQHPTAMRPRNPILWIDGVGGYLLLERDELLIGQAVAGGHQDIGIVGDLSRQAAIIRRSQSDYVIHPLQETTVNNWVIAGPHLLASGAVLGWGSRVRIEFSLPHPLSCSARLKLVSLHRFQPRVDGVILLADSCILGPSPSCHVHCPHWSQDLLMFKSGQQWYFRINGEVEVDGIPQSGQVPMSGGMHVRGSDFSFCIE